MCLADIELICIFTERLQELKIKWASPEQTNMGSTYEATLEGKSCHCFG